MNTRTKRPIALVILDGWGYSSRFEGNAIARAHTPHYDELSAKYPKTILAASGASVGLSADSPGNAEVGHLNLGAGRIVKSDVARISSAIRSGQFFENQTLRNALRSAVEKGRPVHLVGLISDGGVHSSSETLYAILRMAKREGVAEVFVHGILDGRDVPQRTADVFTEALEIKMDDIGLGKIATLCGRHFAMDSSENWDRTVRAFTMMVHSEGERANDAASAIRSSFLRGIADEFIAPIVIETEPDKPLAKIEDGDTVIFFNHRADTMRQLVRTLAVPDRGSIASEKPKLEVVCLTEYERSFQLPAAFPPESGGSTLNSVFTEFGIPNYRVSESDRFPHVTTFLNGGADQPNQFQRNLHVPGPRVSVHEADPELGSFKLTDQLVRAIELENEGVFVANLSAADLVSETGDLDKTIEAVQFVDTCLGGIYETIAERNGVMIVTATHGSCEDMTASTGGIQNHIGTQNPVPFHFIDTNGTSAKLRESGSLQDVAPTLLGILGLEKPADMTGVDLRVV
jgi:2,3-bisphosphoglycerate-independent phosphoglycerate mutase